MSGKKNILAINGAYRDDGITDRTVARLANDLRALGADVEHIRLRDYPIEFCLNCRECMQQPGAVPGKCVLNDGMAELVAKIEAADGYVLAAPTNFFSVTALFKRFLERLAVYGYWPWGEAAPVLRKAKESRKPAVIVSSCAAPAIMGRISYSTNKLLKTAAETIGAKIVGSMVTGMIAMERNPELPRRARRRTSKLAPRLVS